jgi:hypothetical protein
VRRDPFDPQNFPTEEELEAERERKLMHVEFVVSRPKPVEKIVEVDITGLDFDAVAKTIEMMPGGCTLQRHGDRVFVQGLDPEFVVWGAEKQGYIRGRK